MLITASNRNDTSGVGARRNLRHPEAAAAAVRERKNPVTGIRLKGGWQETTAGGRRTAGGRG